LKSPNYVDKVLFDCGVKNKDDIQDHLFLEKPTQNQVAKSDLSTLKLKDLDAMSQ